MRQELSSQGAPPSALPLLPQERRPQAGVQVLRQGVRQHAGALQAPPRALKS